MFYYLTDEQVANDFSHYHLRCIWYSHNRRAGVWVRVRRRVVNKRQRSDDIG